MPEKFSKFKAKQLLNDRLKKDGYWARYNKLRKLLKDNGVDESVAWIIASYPLPPKDGSVHEMAGYEGWDQIAADWRAGLYAYCNEVILAEEEIAKAHEPVAIGERVVTDPYEKLALQVEAGRKASPLDDLNWVMENEPLTVRNIDVATIPSRSAVTLLKVAQSGLPALASLVNQVWAKCLPTKSTLEYEQRFKDDGRSVEMLEEFQRSLLEEEQPVLVEESEA